MKQTLQTRRYEMRAGLMDSGSRGGFQGVANVTGRMDSYGSVIFPGAFRGALAGFLQNGAIHPQHDWDDLIAMPTRAEEVGRELQIEAEFHSTQGAQDMRTIVQERAEKGLAVGLSVGFWPEWDEVAEFKNGADLLAFAQGKGYDASSFDADLATYEGYCWAIPKVRELAEVSIVTRPSNPGSGVTEVRLDDLRAGALGCRAGEHLDIALDAVEGVARRMADLASMRAGNDRTLSSTHRTKLIALQSRIAEVLALSPDPKDAERRRRHRALLLQNQ